MADSGELYDQDFLSWTEQQATALRRAAKNSNLPLDWENLAEEIESLGKSLRRELRSQIRRVLRHLYKLDSSSVDRPRAGWRATIVTARSEIAEIFEESPSLRREFPDMVAKQARIAAELAAADLTEHGEAADAVWTRLEEGGFIADQVVGDWFPDLPPPDRSKSPRHRSRVCPHAVKRRS
jgi:Domain of unknown function DUF29